MVDSGLQSLPSGALSHSLGLLQALSLGLLQALSLCKISPEWDSNAKENNPPVWPVSSSHSVSDVRHCDC